MKTEELEAKVKTLENQVKTLENQISTLQTLQDIEEIKKLQRAYGYYLEHWMYQEIIDCFSDSTDVVIDLSPMAIYVGKKSVERYFALNSEPNPEFLHQLMQLSPVIDIDPDGKTAKGRWYGYGAFAIPQDEGINESIHSGIYENEYVKEDGKWKIKKLSWRVNYSTLPGEGFVKPERVAAADPNFRGKWPEPDILPKSFSARYPSGYIFPCHFKHPVTGKETSEEKRNLALGFESGQ
jgi:hypothetical protein